ncbi:MAG TPA: hypothetical protein VK176_13120 [Phycisphaerales bacterium]|nr:hypothetical protein [Phycisphaerales bacterium]
MSTMERDILISRVVDGLAGDADWQSLERLAESDPTVWRELATAQRHQALLCGLLDRELEVVPHIELPHESPTVLRFPGGSWKWSGWAAAALVGLAWMVGQGNNPVHVPGNTDIAGLPGAGALTSVEHTPDDYLQSYLEHGRQAGIVVGQMDNKPVIELRPIKGERGTEYEVVYARVILERTRLPDVYRLTTDEFGSQFPVRTSLPKGVLTRPPM